MQWMYFFVMVVFGLGAGLLGLIAGINLNPESTVRFIILWGSAEDWTLWGTWAGAAGTICAVVLALHYSRHDDKEKLTVISEVHDYKDANLQSHPRMTFRVVCTGRLPTTILKIGLGTKNDRATLYPIARYTVINSLPKHLSRGEVYEAILDVNSFFEISKDFAPHIGSNAGKLRLVVETGLTTYREKLSLEVIAVLTLSLKES